MTKWKLISMIFMTTRLVNSTREAGTTHIYNCEKYGTCKKSRSQAASAANTSKEYHYTTQYVNPRRAIHRANPERAFLKARRRSANPKRRGLSSRSRELRAHTIRGPDGIAGPPGSRGITGQRGPAGPTGRPGVPGVCDISKCNSQDTNEVEKPDNSFVAFTAGLSKNFTRTTKNNGIIVYDKVQLKYPPTSPNGYSSQTGVFTATTSGIYHFTTSAFALTKPLFLSIVQDRTKRLCTVTSQLKYQTSSCSVTAHLNAGSLVYVQLIKGELFGHSYLFTTFSGHKLH